MNQKNWHMGMKKWYWIATHSIEPCLLCPTRVHPVLKCSIIMQMERDGVARVYSSNGCTTWVPKDKLFDTAKKAWADYNEHKQEEEPSCAGK